MKKKFTLFIVLQMILSSYVIANEAEQKVYDAVCISSNQLKEVKVLKQKDGYQLVKYKKQVLVYLDSQYLEIPKNNCKKDKIPLFVQQ